MKIEIKKKFFLILFLSLCYVSPASAQGGPPAPPCSCCTDLEPTDPTQPSQAYTDCINDCLAGNEPCLPIDSSIVILLLAGASLGFIIVNKKR